MVTNQAGKIDEEKYASFLKSVIIILFLSGAQRRAEGTVGEAESGIGWVWHDYGTDISV